MSIQQKGDIYYVVIPYRDEKNKKKYKWIKSGTSKRKAQELERQILADVSRGQFSITDPMTLNKFFERWIETVIKPNKRPATVTNYQNQIKNIVNKLGNVALEKLNPMQIEEHYNDELSRGLKSTSVQYQHAVLKQALDKAVKWRLLATNPCNAVEAPKRNKPKNAVFTPGQVQKILDFTKDTNLYLPLMLGFLCGLRRGEICGLRWADIDLKEKSAHIRHSLDRMPNSNVIAEEKKGNIIWYSKDRDDKKSVLALGMVKTDESEGYIPLPDILVEELKLEQKKQKKDRLIIGVSYNNYDFVWAWEDGLPHDPDYLYHAFTKKIAAYNKLIDGNKEMSGGQKEKNKLPVIRVHDMRHTHATLLLRQKIDTKIVSKKLRHSRASFTADYYQHVQNDMQKETAVVMDAMFNKQMEK